MLKRTTHIFKFKHASQYVNKCTPILSCSTYQRRYLSSASAKLYDEHIPTNCLQKTVLALGSTVMGFVNPERGDLIAVLGETTGHRALRAIHARMMSDPVGQMILQNKPVINLATLPETTFGGAYYRFMTSHGFVADERAPVRLVDDPELAYVMLRYRQVHDFWHVLSGMGVSVLEEVAVKWLEMVQTGLPMNALSAFGGSARLSFREKITLFRRMAPWAVSTGRAATDLMNVMYEDHFRDDLEEFRQRLNFVPYPK